MNGRTGKRVVLLAVPVLFLAVAARWELSRSGSGNEASTPSGAVEVEHNESAVAGSTLQIPSEVELREGSPPTASAGGKDQADRTGGRVPAPAAASEDADVAAFTNGAGSSLRFEEIDPLLRDANLIVRRTNSTGTQRGLGELETRFSSEGRDPSWSASTESRILSEVAQVANLAVTSHEVECRETICRLKLFYPIGTDTLSSAGRFEPLADVLGFDDSTQVVTLGETGVPMSLVYFQRDED